jgi:hypothetical protein
MRGTRLVAAGHITFRRSTCRQPGRQQQAYQHAVGCALSCLFLAAAAHVPAPVQHVLLLLPVVLMLVLMLNCCLSSFKLLLQASA